MANSDAAPLYTVRQDNDLQELRAQVDRLQAQVNRLQALLNDVAQSANSPALSRSTPPLSATEGDPRRRAEPAPVTCWRCGQEARRPAEEWGWDPRSGDATGQLVDVPLSCYGSTTPAGPPPQNSPFVPVQEGKTQPPPSLDHSYPFTLSSA